MIIDICAIDRRKYWINEIVKISGSFGSDTQRVDGQLNEEISQDGIAALLDRACHQISF